MLKNSFSGQKFRKMCGVILLLSVFLLDAVFRVREYSDKGVDFQVVIKLLIYLAAICVPFVGFLISRSDVRAAYSGANKCLLLLILFFGFGAVFSINSEYALVSVFSLLAFFLLINFLIDKYGAEWVVNLIGYSLFLFLIASLLVYIVFPSLGRISYWEYGVFIDGGRMSGIAGSANNLGRVASLGFIFGIYLFFSGNKTISIWLISISIICLLLSMNRSSALVALIGYLILTYKKKYHLIYTLFFAFGLYLLLWVALNLDFVLPLISRSGEVVEVLTLTGRTYIWDVTIDLIKRNLFLGSGYGSSMFLLPQYESEIGFTASHTHNILLQILLYSGIIGLSLFLISVIAFFREHPSRLQYCLFFFTVANGLLESGPFNGLANITTLTLFLAYSNISSSFKL